MANSAMSGRYDRFGPRTVRAGGRFKFDGYWYQSDRLIELLGERVWIQGADIWPGDKRIEVRMCNYQPYRSSSKQKPKPEPGGFLCYADRAE